MNLYMHAYVSEYTHILNQCVNGMDGMDVETLDPHPR